ncbi:monovalent cation/H(+) antiporter subunit G [Desulfohalovibrio reitneri]|uniref:monovalent cation/H(+) antiporter subunit G n=1 Tax=Desulfohalovibrio reitneri TaxID=1307759 RepID=UPI0004A72514|nr:monovalent cation/H(+) antiporter subunit G [Desulfohalovibrio reitneri]
MLYVACALIFAGLVFYFGGTIGLLRLPDVYSRLHMAGKLDTLGSLCLLLGLIAVMLLTEEAAGLLVAGKIFLIVVFVFIASPTATHDMVDAGMRSGQAPWLRGEERR